MRRLTLDGVAPAESARIALATDVVAGPDASARDAAPTTPTAVVDAALAGDVARCARLLTLDGHPDVVLWWTGLVEPVLAALARRTVVDPPGVDATFAVHAGVLSALRDRPVPPGARPPTGRPRPGRRRARRARSSRTSWPERSPRRGSTRASSAGPSGRTTRSSSPR